MSSAEELARRLSELARATGPVDLARVLEVADLALSIGRWSDAAVLLERVRGGRGASDAVATRLLAAWTPLGKHESAVELLEAMAAGGAKASTELARAFQDALESALARGKAELARRAYATLARWTGEGSTASLRHAELLLDAGDLDAVEERLARVTAAQPHHVLAKLLARRAAGMRASRAIAELELLIARAPYDGTGIAFTHEGQAYRARPSPPFLEALAHREDVVENELAVTLGRFLLERGDADAALRELQRVKRPEPFLVPELVALKGRAWMGKGHADLALEELTTIPADQLVKDGRLDAIELLADLLESHGRAPEALDVLRRVSKDPTPGVVARRKRLELTARTQVEVEGSGPAEAAAPRGLDPGTVIQGVYEVMGELGRGGMGVVLRVRNRKLDRVEALKLLPESSDAAAYERLVREAKLLAKVSHPAIVRVHALGRHEGRPFLAMELLDGETLGSVLRKSGRMPLPEVSWVARATALGLQAAHSGGIVHRDVKPDNIMLMKSNRAVKLMDFGLAHDLGSSSGVKRESFMGTIHYISPEQINGQDVDRTSDVYSFGCVMYEMLTGQTPFDSPNPHNLMFMHLTRPAPSPRLLRPEVPDAMNELVLACLEKSPAKRPADFGAVLARLG